ncbi:MAG: DUF3592 domain-containing protein [Oscillospiraceae bacterium]
MKTKAPLFMMLIGMVFLIVGVMVLSSCIKVMTSYEKTDAVVTSCEKGVEYDSDDDRTTVYYTYADYTVHGETYSAYSKLSSFHSVGEKLPLYYDKAAPDVCEFKADIVSKLTLALVFAAFGILFSVIFIYSLIKGRAV